MISEAFPAERVMGSTQNNQQYLTTSRTETEQAKGIWRNLNGSNSNEVWMVNPTWVTLMGTRNNVKCEMICNR